MTSNVRSLAPIDLRRPLIFDKNLSAFPLNPCNGQMELVNGAIDGISTWCPLTNKKNSYVHTQGVDSFQWTVYHDLNTPDVLFGGDTAPTVDDGKDRGIEFRWHNGTAAKVGFFGFDDSTGKLTFIPDATNTSEVFAGTKGTLDAYLAWADVTGKPTTLAGYGITDAAPLASPALSGVPTAPTAAVNTNTTQIATTAFVVAQIAANGGAGAAIDGSTF